MINILEHGGSAEVKVVARQTNLNKTDGATGHKVCNMTTHPQWNATYPLHRFHIDTLPGNMDYDFAILNLCDPMMFDKGQFLSQFSFDFSGFPN